MPALWDRLVVLLTFGTIALLVWEEVSTLDPQLRSVIDVVDLGICGFFLVDFGVRVAKVRPGQRGQFVMRNWMDLLGAIPVAGPLRAARMVRVIRILRLARLAALARRLVRRYDLPIAPTTAFINLLFVTAAIWFTAALLFYELEYGHNDQVDDFGDALWWSMTTISTVGYGDTFPKTSGGRIVAIATMIMGVGVLGTLAATVATAFVDVRESLRKGLGRIRMKEHLLVLGWNERSYAAVDDFRHDPRHTGRKICIVAELDEVPVEGVRFIHGAPGDRQTLERASANEAAVAMIFADDPRDPRSDHTTTLTTLMLRKVNPSAVIAAELVSGGNREHLEAAGCDSVIDGATFASMLLVRSVQDIGVGDLMAELLSNRHGDTEIYRMPVDPKRHATYAELVTSSMARRITVVGLVRKERRLLHPDPELPIEEGDEAFVLAKEPPRQL